MQPDGVTLFVMGWALACVLWALVVDFYKSMKAEPEKYIEYETNERVALNWQTKPNGKPCHKCGCDDQPVFPSKNNVLWCKWCMEFDGITEHLKNHGVLRWKKEYR